MGCPARAHLARQQELGIIPGDAELTVRPAEIPAWDDMPAELKPVLARQMEVYAGFLEHTDHHLGRIVDALEDLEILDDTLVYYIIGDNGASAEGTLQGTFNELISLNGAAALETTEFMAARIDKFGTPEAYNHYAVGWAHAMDTPYQWTKQVASHWGGTRNGTIVHWPAGIQAKGEVREPVLPRDRRGRRRCWRWLGCPSRRWSTASSRSPCRASAWPTASTTPARPSGTTTQYFEVFCNRGIYHQGWTAVTRHSTPWAFGAKLPALDDDVWELYGPDDWTQAHDLAGKEPGEAAPSCSACSCSKRPSTTCSRWTTGGSSGSTPTWPAARSSSRATRQLLFGGMGRLTENSVVVTQEQVHARSPPSWSSRRAAPRA